MPWSGLRCISSRPPQPMVQPSPSLPGLAQHLVIREHGDPKLSHAQAAMHAWSMSVTLPKPAGSSSAAGCLTGVYTRTVGAPPSWWQALAPALRGSLRMTSKDAAATSVAEELPHLLVK